jgi:putative ABC transport system permease protein
MKSLVKAFLIGMRTAFIEMGHHKLRSFLSMLGVMLGVAALVAMLTLIGGINTFLQDKMGRWTGALWVWSSHHPDDDQKLAWSRSPGMHLSDGDFLQDDTTHVKTVYQSVERRGPVSILGDRYWWVRVKGNSKETFDEDSKQLKLGMGRWFTDQDYASGSRACVISWDFHDQIVTNLLRKGLDTTNIVGADIVFRNVRFRVIGTMVPPDTASKPWQFSWSAVMPLATMQKYISGYDPDPGSVSLIVKDPNQLQAQSQGLAKVLAGKHRGAQDFEYHGADWVEKMTTMLGNISMVMGVISIVSLLVGGLGIMNVMLSSISERIKEIGVRKALGAENLQIFIQFLAETTTLSITGGVFGICIGLLPIAFGDAIKRGTQGAMTPTILPQHALLVVVVVVSVGIVFGLYPAVKASRMNPIDALRYE